MSLVLKHKDQMLVDRGSGAVRIHLADGVSVIAKRTQYTLRTWVDGCDGDLLVESHLQIQFTELPAKVTEQMLEDVADYKQVVQLFQRFGYAVAVFAQASYNGWACLEVGTNLKITPQRPYDLHEYELGYITEFTPI